MNDSRKSRLLELRIGRLKTRARARQHWLEKLLATPPETPTASLRRKHWVAEALDRIKRTQDILAYRAGLLDAYNEHLHVLEMTLMGAAEEKSGKSSPGPRTESSKS
jgi:hypothetical protein